MPPLPDFSGPLTAVSLAFQLAADIGTIRVDTRPVFAPGPQIVSSASPPPLVYFTVNAIPPRPGAAQHGGHGHPVDVTGSRAVASTSAGVLDLRSAAASGTNTTVYVTAMPVTEVGTYVSDQIVDDVKFTAPLEHLGTADRPSPPASMTPPDWLVGQLRMRRGEIGSR